MRESWDALLERGRELKVMEERVDAEAGNVRWLWGDLAIEVAPVGKAGDHSGAENKLRKYADELDISFESLREYRRIASAWPNAMRVANQPWAVHQMFAGRDDREELISNPVDVRTGEVLERWTFRAAQRFLGNKASPVYQAPPNTTEEKAELVAALLEDDAVAELVAALSGAEPRERRELTFDERCAKWVHKANALLMAGAKLSEEIERDGVTLGAHAELALLIYQRIVERHLDAEIRTLLESAETR